MTKLIAILNVIAWSGFWAFGYLAVAAEGLSVAQWRIAALLALGGLVMGALAWALLVRAARASGYARKHNQLDATARERAHLQEKD